MTKLTGRPAAAPPDDEQPARSEAGAPRKRLSGQPASPRLGFRELVTVPLLACVLAIVMTWPLVLDLGGFIAQDLGDPIRTAWQVAWEGYALTTQPLAIFQSNAFWPLPDSLAFSDSLLGYAPAGLVGEGPVAAVVRYNLLFLFAYALAFVGAYLLARELGAGRAGAAVAGAAFAYAPFRLAMNGHLHVISSGGIPLALFFMLRGYRGARPALIVTGWAVAAWQLSLGFTLGLQLVYLLGALTVIAGIVWLRRGRPMPSRAVMVATAAGVAVLMLVGVLQTQPYLRVAERYAGAQRSEKLVANFSPVPKSFLVAPVESRVWGPATAGLRTGLAGEKTLFLGAAILPLALIGLTAASPYPRRVRRGLAAGALVTAILALGFGLANGNLGYRLLFELAPGWDAVRTPGRIVTLTSLALALLAAAGAQALVGLARRGAERRGVRPAAVGAVAGGLLVAAVLLDGAGEIPRVPVPPAPLARMAQPDPQLHAPTGNDWDRLYMLWSTGSFPRIVNGTSTFSRRELLVGRQAMRRFPDRRSVERLRRRGVRTVVVHLDIADVPFPPPGREQVPITPAPTIAARSVAGLPLRLERVPGALVYHLDPPERRLGSPPS